VKKLYEGDANILQDLCLDRFPGKQNYASPIFIACEGSPTVKDPVLIGFNKEKFFEVRMMGPFSRESPQLSIELMLAYHQRVPNVVSKTLHFTSVFQFTNFSGLSVMKFGIILESHCGATTSPCCVRKSSWRTHITRKSLHGVLLERPESFV